MVSAIWRLFERSFSLQRFTLLVSIIGDSLDFFAIPSHHDEFTGAHRDKEPLSESAGSSVGRMVLFLARRPTRAAFTKYRCPESASFS